MRIVAKMEKIFGKIDDKVKQKEIGVRDFSKVDVTIFTRKFNYFSFSNLL